jgi:ketosteroid isomerase-like protein
MSTTDPKLIALQFNECINRQDVDGLAELMTEDHTFIDREGKTGRPKEFMIQGWREFFRMFPKYRNTFTRIQSQGNLVRIIGSAYWSEDQPYDPVIWTATVVDDRIQEWRVYADTDANRHAFDLV